MTSPAPEPRPLIVAAALTRGQRFFAARRTYPPTLAGLWEFPGGKVEPGEDPHTALVRECREELGVEITVGEEIASPDGLGWPLANGLRMRVFLAELSGDSTPEHLTLTEAHDDGAWLPLTLTALETPWIEADRPIVEALLQALGS